MSAWFRKLTSDADISNSFLFLFILHIFQTWFPFYTIDIFSCQDLKHYTLKYVSRIHFLTGYSVQQHSNKTRQTVLSNTHTETTSVCQSICSHDIRLFPYCFAYIVTWFVKFKQNVISTSFFFNSASHLLLFLFVFLFSDEFLISPA